MKTSSENEELRTRKKLLPALYVGLLPVLLVIALILFEYLWPSSARVYEPELLLPILNTTLFLAACVIAYIAGRIYLLSGLPTILWIGCGVLALALGALTAGWLIIPFGPNVNVTIFNVGAFLASICHMGAVAATLGEKPGEVDLRHRKRNVGLGYLTILLGIALVVVLTITGLMPTFFIQGQGPTNIRQNVAGWTIVLFIISALFTLKYVRRQRASFLYWYALALVLLALAMLAFLLQPGVGSPIGWVGRGSYVLAAVYFLISVSAGLREARTRKVSPHQPILELLDPRIHWQGILATMSDAVVSFDDRGKILLWNKSAERIFGFSESEVLDKNLYQVLPCTKAIVLPSFIGGITEINLVRQDGSRFSAEVSVSVQDSSMGMISTLIIRDVSARQQAEEALAASRAQFEAIFNSIGDAVIFVDRERRMALLNPAVETMFGYKREQLLGQPTKILYADPDDYERLGRLRYHDAVEAAKQIQEIKYRREDGTVFEAETVGNPVYDEHGRHLGFMGIHRDVTEHKRAETALREREARVPGGHRDHR